MVVDVSNAEAYSAGDGHGYLRRSPWVTSDLLMTLAYSLKPQDRGLVKKYTDILIWTFPPQIIRKGLAGLSGGITQIYLTRTNLLVWHYVNQSQDDHDQARLRA